MRHLAVALITVASLLPATSHAAIYTVSGSVFASSDSNPGPTYLDPFPSHLGTLRHISFAFDGQVIASVQTECAADCSLPDSSLVQSTVQITYFGPGLGGDIYHDQFVLTGYDASVDASLDGSVRLPDYALGPLQFNPEIAISTDPTPFLGSGAYAVPYAVLNGTITVDYVYSPVPEPMSAGLLLMGLGVLGVVHCRRLVRSPAPTALPGLPPRPRG